MRTSHKFTRTIFALFALLTLSTLALAADPGAPYPATAEASDQKAGSILVYNAYTSSSSGAASQNARISLTNTNTQFGVAVHLFFVDGSSCSIADSYICLTPNQTASFLASDVDPGVSGYIIAVAVDLDGLPLNFNYLIGDEFVKYSSGHYANLGAIAFAKLNNTNVISPDGAQAALFYDGLNLDGSYNRAPRVVAVDNISDSASGNNTLIILNRFGGNLSIGASTLGTVFGILYDDAESAYSFSISGGCQLRASLSDSFPRTVPRFSTVIPAGRSGWMKLYSNSDIAILGAAINFNTNAGTAPNAFNGGHNLHALTLSAAATHTIPVFGPSC